MNFVGKLTAPKTRTINLGLTGKYANLRDAYASIDKALEHCGAHLGVHVEIEWIDTTDVTDANVQQKLSTVDAVIVPGGFGSRGVEGKISCVKHCRERGVPYLGICLGFQVAVIEFARNVLGFKDASSTEFSRTTMNPVIAELPEQKKIEGLGGTMRLGAQDVVISPGSLASFLYRNQGKIRERFRHRYEVEPKYVDQFEKAGLIFSGRHPSRPIMQVLELRQVGDGGAGADSDASNRHPFFIGAQFHPELTSRPLKPQPMFMGLLAAAIERKYAGQVPSSDPFAAELTKWVRKNATQPVA
jgi:CTP synthase